MLTNEERQLLQSRLGKPTVIKKSPINFGVEEKKDKGVGGFEGFALGAGKGIASTFRGLSSVGEKILRKPLETVGLLKKQEKTGAETLIPDEITTPIGSAEKLGFFGEQIGEFFIPIPGLAGVKGIEFVGKGKKLASFLAKSGIEGVDMAIKTMVQSGGDVAETVAAGGIGTAFGAGGQAVNQLLKNLPKRLVQSAVGQKAKFIEAGQDVSEYVLKNKKIGTARGLIEEGRVAMKKLNTEISNNLRSVKVIKDKVTVKNILDEMVAKYEKTSGATKEEIIDIIVKSVPDARVLLGKPSMGLINANRLRQIVDDTLGDRAFLSSQLPYNKKVLREFAGRLREAVKSKAPEGTRALFDDLANEIRLSNALSDKVAKGSGNQILSFGDLLGGGLGSALGGIGLGSVAGVAGRRILQSTPFLTGLGVTLEQAKRLEPVLEKLTPIEMGTLSQIIQSIGKNK